MGGGGKSAPPPAPVYVPPEAPAEPEQEAVSQAVRESEEQKRQNALRKGMAGTIKTSPLGVMNSQSGISSSLLGRMGSGK